MLGTQRTPAFRDSPALADLRRWAEELMRSNEEVLAVLLLGPLLRGEGRFAGRHDVIVIVESSSIHPWQRARHLPPLPVDLRHDKMVYTQQEFRRLRESGNFFIRRVLAEGLWLARGGARLPDAPALDSPEAPGCIG